MDELVGFVDEQYERSDKDAFELTIENIFLHSDEHPDQNGPVPMSST
jgi:hypothetical protein